MFKIFRNAIKAANSNIILTIPLIIFVKLIDLYSSYSNYDLDFLPKFIISTVTILFMFGIFCSAWFFMVRGAVDNSEKIFILDNDRTKASLSLFKTIPEGVSRLFLPFIGVYLIFLAIQVILTPVVYYLGINLIGSLDAESLADIQTLALTSVSESNSMAVLLDKLQPSQIVFFAKWSLLFMVVTSVVMYLLTLWVPEIVYHTTNPLKALFKSIAKLFRKFFETSFMFAMLWFLGFILLFLNTFSMINPVIYLVMNVVSFYFILYLSVCIFLYYKTRFCEDEE